MTVVERGVVHCLAQEPPAAQRVEVRRLAAALKRQEQALGAALGAALGHEA